MKRILVLGVVLALAAFMPTSLVAPHINLLSPTPVLNGHHSKGRSQKTAPFGAPNIDASAAAVTNAISGSELELEIEEYIYHAGEIVVLWTRDPEGKDIAPVMQLSSSTSEIPHVNLIHRMRSPCRRDETGCLKGTKGAITFKTTVTLPNIEGAVYLVVRQVMTDRMEELADGTISLDRVYYHQAAKLNLVKNNL